MKSREFYNLNLFNTNFIMRLTGKIFKNLNLKNMTTQELKAQDIFKFIILILFCKGCTTVKPVIKNNQINYNCELVTKNINEKRDFVFDNKSFDYEYYNDFVKNVTDGIFITFFYEQNPYHNYMVFKDFNFEKNNMIIEKNKKSIVNSPCKDLLNSFLLIEEKKEYVYSCIDGSTNQVIFLFEMRKNGEKYVRFTSIDYLKFDKNNLGNNFEEKKVFNLINKCIELYWELT